jgi:hypothetical protein
MMLMIPYLAYAGRKGSKVDLACSRARLWRHAAMSDHLPRFMYET